MSMGFPRQKYWNGLSFLSLGDIPNLGIKLVSPTLQADSFLLSHLGSLIYPYNAILFSYKKELSGYEKAKKNLKCIWLS